MMHIVTYKVCPPARIPVRYVLVETGCSSKHAILLSLRVKVERRIAREFLLTVIVPCEMKGNSLDSMLDILVVHDVYCDLQSLYNYSYSSQIVLG